MTFEEFIRLVNTTSRPRYIRFGQHLSNLLSTHRPDISRRVPPHADVFYMLDGTDPEKLSRYIAFVESAW